jgi:LPS O-antigen subunit length determinant protein (WzzB/FepE family)
VSLKRNLKNLKRTFYRHFWWFILAACLAALLFYGLSAFTAKPTVETITTHAPVVNANTNQLREVDYQPSKRARRRGSN